MPPARRVGPRTPHPPEPFLPSADILDTGTEPDRDPEDPARVAAGLMLGRALEAIGASFELVGRDGTVCSVLVPAHAWTGIVREEWRVRARGGEGYDDMGAGRSWTKCRWAAWAPDDALGRALRGDNEAFSRAVWKGVHCLGVAADLSLLPVDLMQAADHRLTLPPLTGADLAAVARRLCGRKPACPFPDGEAAAATPRLLRLARRPGQTANAYLAKLRDLIAREWKSGDFRGAASPAAAAADSPRTAPALDRLHGLDEAAAWGRALARDLTAYRAGTLPWSAVDRGCLLSGPPGCGKTLFARALAATCGVPLISGSYSQGLGTGGGHQGDLLKSMRRAFADARERAPSLLFVDEIDSFPDRARVGHRYREWDTQVVNALLSEIDGVQGREGVVLLAACNHADRLDPALVRSGRLDRHIHVGLPDRRALQRILREHLGADLAGEDLAGAALAAAGLSGADCERVVRGARRRARQADRPMLISDLLTEIDGDPADHGSPGIDGSRWVGRSAADLRLAAVHEAGHAVAVCVLYPGGLGLVSLREAGSIGGRTSVAASSGFLRSGDVHRRLVVLLAGRAAEEEILGAPSSGAGGGPQSDLAKATGLAALAVASFGLDSEGGLIWRGTPDPVTLPGVLASDPVLAARVQALLDGAYADARELVHARRAAVEALARVLTEQRTLDGGEAAAIVTGHPVDDAAGATP